MELWIHDSIIMEIMDFEPQPAQLGQASQGQAKTNV